MNITKLKGSNKRSGLCLLEVEGDLNIYNAAEFKLKMLDFVDGFNDFEMDFSAVNEIDTAGIQLLLQFNRKAVEAERSLQLTGCNEQVCDFLQLYQLQDWVVPATNHNSAAGGI